MSPTCNSCCSSAATFLLHAHAHTYICIQKYTHTSVSPVSDMRWLRVVGSLKWQVSFAKEPYEKDIILQKRSTISLGQVLRGGGGGFSVPQHPKSLDMYLHHTHTSRYIHTHATPVAIYTHTCNSCCSSSAALDSGNLSTSVRRFASPISMPVAKSRMCSAGLV